MTSRYNKTRIVLIVWALFIGVGAVAGSVGMFVDPTGKVLGMDAMLPLFKKLPFADTLFKDFIFPAIALLIVNGLTNLTAAALLIRKKWVGNLLSLIFGCTLMAWICIQFYIFPLNFMSTIYFIFGFIQAATGIMALTFYRQEQFTFDEEMYGEISKSSDTLIVYFSRMGYTKKLAYERANELEAEIYEIKPTEKTSGTLGFWWCGRFGMHKWEMPIEPCTLDLGKYKKVIIFSPIWVFNVAAPVRAFCRQARGKINACEYVLVHYTNLKYAKAKAEMDECLGLNATACESVTCKKGAYKRSIKL